MDITQASDGIAIAGNMTHQEVVKAWPEQQQSLHQRDNLNVDLAKVEQIDTAGLAWLIQLISEARQQDCQVQLSNTPQSLLNLAKLSDIDSYLPLQ